MHSPSLESKTEVQLKRATHRRPQKQKQSNVRYQINLEMVKRLCQPETNVVVVTASALMAFSPFCHRVQRVCTAKKQPRKEWKAILYGAAKKKTHPLFAYFHGPVV